MLPLYSFWQYIDQGWWWTRSNSEFRRWFLGEKVQKGNIRAYNAPTNGEEHVMSMTDTENKPAGEGQI
jgi:hypothetical protein